MITRRDCVRGFAAGAACAVVRPVLAARDSALRQRRIPGTNEWLPVIGLGSSGSFEVANSPVERAALAPVLRAFVVGGGRLIDTSPNYSSAEDVLGDLMTAANLQARVFIATKLSAVGRKAGFAQFKDSQRRLQTPRIDLLQVHNLRDWRTQIEVARELQARGQVRYVGLTHYLDSAHADLADALRAARPDFVQLNYSIVSRAAERSVLPLARDLGIAVIVNRAFEDGQLFARVRGRALPAVAIEHGAASWAQLFLRFVIAHPAVTCVIPATSKLRNLHDNLAAGIGPLPDTQVLESWARELL